MVLSGAGIDLELLFAVCIGEACDLALEYCTYAELSDDEEWAGKVIAGAEVAGEGVAEESVLAAVKHGSGR